MKKMIKTAIVTTTLLASASIFAQNVGVNANGSAQVNVESGGLIKGVTGAVKNTAQGVGHVAQHNRSCCCKYGRKCNSKNGWCRNPCEFTSHQ